MIDLTAAREKFDNSVDFTVGIEEEFSLLDQDSFELVPKYELLRDAAADDVILSESQAGELISSEIEIRSGVGADVDEAIERQVVRRKLLFDLAAANGVSLGATATHPTSDYRDQQIIDTPHYRQVAKDLQYVVWRNNTFSLHIHVGIKGADRAVKVCDRLRPVLPLLLAVSANSPFLDGGPTGLHSTRSQIFTRMFPRCGIPDAFGSWDTWEKYVAMLSQTKSISEFTQIWWSVRPHHSFGTVEVRICDIQMTADESNALAKLVVACIRQAAQEIDGGVIKPPLPSYLIEENFWRAIRFGKDGSLLDFEKDPVEVFPASEIVERLCSWAGTQIEFPEMNGAQRQRAMIDEGVSAIEIFAASVSETEATYNPK